MTPKQKQWTALLALAIVALILTSEFGRGLGWVAGWSLFGWHSLQKLACHGGLDSNLVEREEEY